LIGLPHFEQNFGFVTTGVVSGSFAGSFFLSTPANNLISSAIRLVLTDEINSTAPEGKKDENWLIRRLLLYALSYAALYCVKYMITFLISPFFKPYRANLGSTCNIS
jgi:hypothetical protein